MKGWLDNFGKADNANKSNVSLPEDFNGLAYDTTGRNYSPAWGGQFQNGGKLTPVSPLQQIQQVVQPTPTVPYLQTKDPREFFKSWIQTPEYKQRLKDTGYGDLPYKWIDGENVGGIDYTKQQRLHLLENIQPFEYDKYKKSEAKPFDIGGPTININPFDYKDSSRQSIEAHEIAHVGTPTMSYQESEIIKNSMLPIEKPVLSGVQGSKEREASIRALEDWKHLQDPDESKADLDALRFMMYDRGIYDITKGIKFTESDFEKAQQELGKDRVFKRFSDRMGKKNFVKLMNTIALSDDQQEVPLAMGGMSIPGSVGFTYARTSGSAPSNGKYAKKTMASAQNGDQISYNDPRYAELYKNRQVGSWSPQHQAFNLPDLPEFTVIGNDESLKETMYQGSNRFLRDALGVLGSSQTVPMELITGKQQTPSEAWGFDTTNKPWYHPKSISNFAMDAALDPMNLIGVGVADDLTRGLARRFGKESIGNQIQFDPIMLKQITDRSTSDLISKLKNRTQSSPTLRGYEDDILDRRIYNTANESNQLPPSPSEIVIQDNILGFSNQQSLGVRSNELYRQGVKDILGYRDIDVSRVNTIYDLENALKDWLDANRFETPNFEVENFRNLFNRYNIPADQTDVTEMIRSIDPSQKPQFLRDLLSEFPRSMSEDDLFNARINYNNRQVERNASASASKPITRNKSGFTKDEVIQASKDKDKISKMTDEEFQNTVMKPSGEIVEYVQGTDIDNLTYDVNSGRTVLKDQQIIEPREYANIFNQNIDRLNEIIASKNRSGVQYRVKELNPSGYLKFETPEQTILDPSGISTTIPSGESIWAVRLNPGQWKGEVQDLANSDYYRSIPGLEMSNTTGTVFSDRNPRRGTGAYEAINDYLKELNLGRVKPGFNSQTQFSKGAWENFIKSGRGVGYYANPNLVYGTMKTVLPVGFGASYLSNQNREFKKGGIIKDNQGYWNPDNWGKPVEIDSNDITMRGVYEPLLGISDMGDVQYMTPGNDYKFKGSKVTEFPVAQEGVTTPAEQEISREDYLSKFKMYDDVLKSMNYTTPYYKDNNIDTSVRGMNCINGVCQIVSNVTGVKFDKAQTKNTYTGNATFGDNAMAEGYYRSDPTKEGFSVGDIFQYSRKKSHWKSRFPGEVDFRNENDLYPNHAVLLVEEYEKDGDKWFKIANNYGGDKVDFEDVSQSDLLERYEKGYKDFQGGITYRYDPERVASIKKENLDKENLLKGKNQYAKDYLNYDPSNLSFFNNRVEGLKVTDELAVDKNLQKYADVYKTAYKDLGAGSNMPLDSFNKLILNQIGIAGQETKFGELAENSKDLIPDALLPAARRSREIYNSNFGTLDNWTEDYWKNNADNVQSEFDSYEDFRKSLRSEDSDFNPYRVPRSIGVFQQKDLSERGKFYGYDLDSFEGQVKSSLALAVDNYHKLKAKYPDLSEDEIIDLTTLMHNAPGKAFEPRFVNYYLKKGDVDYINKVKGYSPKSLGKNQPAPKKKEEVKFEPVSPEKAKSIANYLSSLPTKKNGGSVGINDLDAQSMKKLNQLINFTNNPDKINWLDKYQ